MTTGFLRLLGTGLGMAALAIPGHSVGADEKPDVYAKDVAAMLDELPKEAGHFFESKHIDWKAVSEEFTREVKILKAGQPKGKVAYQPKKKELQFD